MRFFSASGGISLKSEQGSLLAEFSISNISYNMANLLTMSSSDMTEMMIFSSQTGIVTVVGLSTAPHSAVAAPPGVTPKEMARTAMLTRRVVRV